MAALARHLGSVRVRTTIAASLVVGLALVLASVALVVLLGRSLTSNARDVALSRAEAVVATLDRGGSADLDAGESDDEFVQVLSTDGTVSASSGNVTGRPALVRIENGGETTTSTLPSGTPLEGTTFLVVSVEDTSSDGARSVLWAGVWTM